MTASSSSLSSLIDGSIGHGYVWYMQLCVILLLWFCTCSNLVTRVHEEGPSNRRDDARPFKTEVHTGSVAVDASCSDSLSLTDPHQVNPVRIEPARIPCLVPVLLLQHFVCVHANMPRMGSSVFPLRSEPHVGWFCFSRRVHWEVLVSA